MWMVVAVVLTLHNGSYEFEMRSLDQCMRVADAQMRGLKVELYDPEGERIDGITSVECHLHDMRNGDPRQIT